MYLVLAIRREQPLAVALLIHILRASNSLGIEVLGWAWFGIVHRTSHRLGVSAARWIAGLLVALPHRLPWWLKLANPVVTRLNRWGLAVGTQHILTIPGRKSGKLYSTPVSLLTVAGNRYIVSFPWTGWVKNARAAGGGLLERGRRREWVHLVEVPPGERARVVREFPVQVPHGVAFFRLPPDPSAFEQAAPHLTAFRIEPA